MCCQVSPDNQNILLDILSGRFQSLILMDCACARHSRSADILTKRVDGPSLTPEDPKNRARMMQDIGLIDSYGYDALIGAAGYHLFPDFIGGQNEEAHRNVSWPIAKLCLKLAHGN